jgi:hypothetical protein
MRSVGDERRARAVLTTQLGGEARNRRHEPPEQRSLALSTRRMRASAFCAVMGGSLCRDLPIQKSASRWFTVALKAGTIGAAISTLKWDCIEHRFSRPKRMVRRWAWRVGRLGGTRPGGRCFDVLAWMGWAMGGLGGRYQRWVESAPCQ